MFKRYRPTYLEINLSNIYHNYKSVQDIVHPKTVIPVVKADAYGHGAIKVVEYLVKKGISYFAVSLLEEALELRECFQDIDILVMGVSTPDELAMMATHRIEFTVSDHRMAEAVKKFSHSLTFHIKYDSGMNRLGFTSDEEVIELFRMYATDDEKHIKGVFTHFATADSDSAYYGYQLARFNELLAKLPYIPETIHASNSSSSIKYEKDIKDTTHVRLGISLYGESLDQGVQFLKPTFHLKSTISQIKTLQKGDYLGYDITYRAKQNQKIGILPIGYADGLIRKNQDRTVMINQKAYSIVGRICMDMSFVRIDETVQLNDEVTLLGNSETTVSKVAKYLDTIPHEVLCLVTKRVPRIYKEEEQS